MEFKIDSPWTYRDALGEGPLWDAETQTLIRVDCERGLLHWLDVETGDQVTHNLGGYVGFAALSERGDVVVSVHQSLYGVSRDGARRLISDGIAQADGDSNSFNDGKSDSRGRLFAGTLDPDWDHAGAFYRVDDQGIPRQLFGAVSASNGLDWDYERGLMYWTDSLEYRIDVFDYDLETGEASGRRPFAQLDAIIDGMPDGMTVDAEGGLWVALFQGGKVRRYAPDGSITADIELPTSCPTSITIGGPDGHTAYVTSSFSWLKDEEKLAQPLGGGIFRFDAGVQGQVPGRVKL